MNGTGNVPTTWTSVGHVYEEIGSVYGSGSWAIDDLIRLLERSADKAGATTSDDGPEAAQVSQELDTAVGCEPAAPVFSNDRNAATVTVLDQVSAACWNDDAMRSEFELMRQVLQTHATHPLLDEELREFLEPSDTDIPTEFLGNPVREVLETPFVRLARRWVGRGRVRCLLNLLDRAVASIRSLTGCSNEDSTIAEVVLRPRTIPVARDIKDDGKSWRAYCEIIHEKGLDWLMLGTVAQCSWAIDDLIRLLERIADETGAEENGVANELRPVMIGGDSFVGSQSVRSVSSKHSDEIESVASPHSPASHGDEVLQ